MGPDDESVQSQRSSVDDDTSRNMSIVLDNNQRKVELYGNAPGLLTSEPEIKFLDHRCTLALHHIKDTSFRVSISTADVEKVNSLFLEVDLDTETFGKYFKVIEHESFMSGKELVALKSGEVPLQSLQIVDETFIEAIKPGILQFEQYIRTEFGR